MCVGFFICTYTITNYDAQHWSEVHVISRKFENERLRRKQEEKEIIDGLLDIYNDYKWLYERFGDEQYEQMMEQIIEQLKKFTRRRRRE